MTINRKSTRGSDGRFLKGHEPGPGRPHKQELPTELLVQLVGTSHDPYITAMQLKDKDKMEDVRKDFPKEIADKVERIAAIDQLASNLLIQRLMQATRDAKST